MTCSESSYLPICATDRVHESITETLQEAAARVNLNGETKLRRRRRPRGRSATEVCASLNGARSVIAVEASYREGLAYRKAHGLLRERVPVYLLRVPVV